MRNLKKILALVLALMMVVSVMVTASATTFVDDADINAKYAEAVTVLSGIGVIRGEENADGTFNFNPKGELTRAQAAVIIAYIREGKLDNIADEVSIYENPFTDVPAWAAPYVLYAHSNNIIVGRNATTFDPNATITGYEFGKMLLVAADLAKGSDFLETVYVVNGVQYTDSTLATIAALNNKADIDVKVVGKSDWQVLVASELKSEDHKIWNNEFKLSKKLTREEACYLAFNTMNESALMATVFDNATHVAEDALTADKFGRPETNKWLLGTATMFVTYAKPVATVNGATFDHDSTANAKIYNFGSAAITFNGGTNADFDTMAELEKPGVTIELYGEYNKTTKLYDIDTVVAYAYEMATVAVADDKDITLTIGTTPIEIAAPAKDAKPSDLYAYVSAYKNGDVLSLIAKPGYTDESDLAILESAVAEYVNGTVTATGDGYFRVNGVKQVSGILSTGSYTSLTKTGNFYLDPNGLVLGFGAAKAADVDTDYIYVLATAVKAAGSKTETDGLFGSSTENSAAAAQAMVLNITTGEISKVDLGVVYDEATKAYYFANKYGVADTSKKITADVEASDTDAGFYTYTVLADGSYVLVAKETDHLVEDIVVDEEQVELKSGLYATSATNYTKVLITTEDGKWNSTVKDIKVINRTGVDNFPYGDWGHEGDALVFTDEKSGVATDIFAVELVAYKAPTAKGYAVYAGEGETDGLGTKHGFYVDGEYVEYYATADMSTAVKGTLYYVTRTNGVVTAFENSSFSKVATGKVAYIDAELDYVLVGGTTYTLKDGYVVVDSADDYAVSKLTVGETVELYSYKDKVVYAIIVDAE